jgi:sulfite reductase beta subunit-like hemoprotein
MSLWWPSPAAGCGGCSCPPVGEWCLVGVPPDQGKAIMAGKDKGGRASKTPATKTAKEKKKSKNEKKAAKGGFAT